MIYDTTIKCSCGGRVRIEDHDEISDPHFRFESFCDACHTCDPNGWPTRAQAAREARSYFQEAE